METAELAIIVPVWKPAFLEPALQSIELQSAKKYSVYLFDDAAPDEAKNICLSYLKRNPGWKYHRFEENMGGQNLAAHWNRCIRLTTEKWLWLFSDDDEMDAESVAEFYEAVIRFPEHAVFRLPFRIIDESGLPMPVNTTKLKILSGAEFGRMRFLRQLDSSAAEFIFSREAFNKSGGFPEFPAAWCSDDAAWIKFCGNAGIRCLEKGGINWRWSAFSISGSGGKWTIQKLQAAIQFINWYNSAFPESAADNSFRAEQVIWLRLQMAHQHYRPGCYEVFMMIQKLKYRGVMNKLRCFQDLFCMSYVYHQRVVLHKNPAGIRFWLSQILPAF